MCLTYLEALYRELHIIVLKTYDVIRVGLNQPQVCNGKAAQKIGGVPSENVAVNHIGKLTAALCSNEIMHPAFFDIDTIL